MSNDISRGTKPSPRASNSSDDNNEAKSGSMSKTAFKRREEILPDWKTATAGEHENILRQVYLWS